VILKWFLSPLLLLISLLLSHCTCAKFLLCCPYIFKIFSASFLITFLHPEIAKSINMHVTFLLSWIMMSGLLLGIVLLVCFFWFHNVVTLPSGLVSLLVPGRNLRVAAIIIIIIIIIISFCHFHSF
jgi:hypothetical protein